MVGGVSLVANYRTEFANTVRDSGIDGLIKNLQAKNRSLDSAGRRSDPARRAPHRGERPGDARQRRRAARGRPPAPRRGRRHRRPRRGDRDGFGAARRSASPGCATRAPAKRELAFVNPPEALQTLARLYGVRQPLPAAHSLNAIEVRGVEKRYGALQRARRREPGDRRRASSSACSARTAPARPR